MVDRRGVIAAVLGFVYPGLGHVYLRRWVRALSWFGVALVVAAVVVPESAYQAFQARGLQGLLEASETFGPEVTLSLLAVRLLNVVDAYRIATREAAAKVTEKLPGDVGSSDQAATCPNCGGELDSDLDFCPWCTQRLGDANAAEDSA